LVSMFPNYPASVPKLHVNLTCFPADFNISVKSMTHV
jgi:hypothetical protein